MGTLSVTTSGFAALPATPPSGWPSWVTYPGAVAPNGTKAFTISDGDLQLIMNWVASTYPAATPPAPPPAPTLVQLLVHWLQLSIVTGTTQAVQVYHTTPPVTPPPITIS